MANANPEFQYNSTHHPTDEELLDYFRGRLIESGAESVQSHLVACDECIELFQDVRDFFEPHRESEQMITANIAHEWRSLWERIQGEGKMEARLSDSRERLAARPWIKIALAAMLLIAIGIGAWGIMQRRQKQQLAQQLEAAQLRSAQLQTDQQNQAPRMKQLEQENLELQERLRSAAPSRPPQRVEIRRPEINAPIYDLYAQNLTRRSGGSDDVNRIKLPMTAPSIVLILNGEGLDSSSSYAIEIVGNNGQTIWRAKGLRRGELGNFTLTIDRAFLAKGTYRLKLYGQDVQLSKPLAEYIMRIE